LLLVLHLPAGNDFAAPSRWTLFNAAGHSLRSGADSADSVPRAERVWAIVPASRVLFAELALPPVSQTRLDELLPFAVEDSLMSDPAAIVAVAGPAGRCAERASSRVVAVTDKAWLNGALAHLKRLGLEPDAVLPESALTGTEAGTWHAVMPGGHKEITQDPAREGVLVRDDGFAIAFDFSPSGEAPFALQLAIKEAAARNNGPVRLLLVGGDNIDAAAWTAQLGVPVATQSANAHPLPTGKPAFDFLTSPAMKSFAKRSGWRDSLALLRPAAIVAGAIAVLHLTFLGFDTWRLDRERNTIEIAMVDTFKRTFPDARAIVDPPLQMRRNLDALQRERGAASDPFTAAAARAAQLVEAESGVRVKSMKYSSQRTVVELEADDAVKLRQVANGRAEVLPGTPPRARLTLEGAQ
jgi:general secretion pathway protein L